LGKGAKEMLVKWEANDPEVRDLWKKMNGWVLGGFNTTYNSLGVDFDKLYFESDTYLLGKELIQKGLEMEVLHQEGKRVWTDLENIGLAKKTIIKSDGYLSRFGNCPNAVYRFWRRESSLCCWG